jgi:type IV pilus assembly protein PilV
MRGFSMVETLVALLVLTVGLLGMARLFVEGLTDNRSALYRTQAVHLARDLAERIRANGRGGARADADTDTDADTADYSLAAGDTPLLQDCVAAGIGCAPIALARDDLARWLVAIHDTLPGDGRHTPGGTVSVDTSTTPATYTLTVYWSEPGAGERSFVLRVRT